MNKATVASTPDIFRTGLVLGPSILAYPRLLSFVGRHACCDIDYLNKVTTLNRKNIHSVFYPFLLKAAWASERG